MLVDVHYWLMEMHMTLPFNGQTLTIYGHLSANLAYSLNELLGLDKIPFLVRPCHDGVSSRHVMERYEFQSLNPQFQQSKMLLGLGRICFLQISKMKKVGFSNSLSKKKPQIWLFFSSVENALGAQWPIMLLYDGDVGKPRSRVHFTVRQ